MKTKGTKKLLKGWNCYYRDGPTCLSLKVKTTQTFKQVLGNLPR